MTDPTIRPGDIPTDVSLTTLVARLRTHAAAMVDHRHGLVPLAPSDVAGHCLGALMVGAVLAERVTHGRWLYVCGALSAGAGVERVAAALGWEAEELRAGLRSWAHGQLRHGLITPARHGEVLALLAEAGTEGGEPR